MSSIESPIPDRQQIGFQLPPLLLLSWARGQVQILFHDLLDLPCDLAANFTRMLERPSVEKLLAYENDVSERFAKTA